MRESESVHKLHIMANKNYLQDVGLVSSGQRRKLHQSHVQSHFARFSQIEWIWSEGLLPTQKNDVLKQMRAFFSTMEPPITSFPDSHPPTTETAIFVKSHLKTWLFSLPRGANQLSNLVIQDLLSLLGLLGWWAGARRAASRRAFRGWIGEF